MTNLHEALKILRHQNGSAVTTAVDDLLPSDQSEDEKIAVAEEQKKNVELCPW